ncbi:MAG: YdaU family protein [Lentisphaerae bacterium]|nr:YdaU family protein [Lentisphaerota bacterium]
MKPPSFPFYVNNWLASERVTMMEPEQVGAFILLLCYQWNSDSQSIPNDDATLARLSRLNARWETYGPAVKACFNVVDGNRLRNERLHHCWVEAHKFREQQRLKGLKSGCARRATSR